MTSHDQPRTARTVLAMDAGQSGVRTELRDDHGTTLAASSFAGVRTDLPLLDQLARCAREALASAAGAGAGDRADVLAIGSSGLVPGMTAAGLAALLPAGRIGEVRLAHDSITSYLAALGDRPGVVVAAGTGVVTLAVGEHDVARVDGWGYLLGDAGSGYWIGRAALDAVLRAHDGRGPATSLTVPATEAFDDLETAYVELQADELKVSRIAAWARTVAEHAEAGDEVARRISRDAGRELALSAVAGLRRVGQDVSERPAVSAVGKVFHSPWVARAFAEVIAEALPAAELVTASGEGIDGAARLAGLGAASALGRSVDTASAATR